MGRADDSGCSSLLGFPQMVMIGVARTGAGITLQGPTAMVGGLVVLVLAYLNWRFVERVTRATIGKRQAERLAHSPIGNRVGGTFFLVIVGGLMVIGGTVEALGH
jgi:peptidoglycan/LPS O-acetylase OafA/YrhL